MNQRLLATLDRFARTAGLRPASEILKRGAKPAQTPWWVGDR
jgi:hypothetical protein